MRLLVLGGTAWLGSHLVAAACAQGHEVTCVARGLSGAVPRGATLLRADRDLPGAYDSLAGRRWDAVIDLARLPGQVRSAVAALAGTCGSFVFVSSASVYADNDVPGQDESAALLPPLASDVMESPAVYGQAKVACEQAVLAAMGAERSLILRPGLIGGPGDESGRTGYWPLRFHKAAQSGHPVLVPDAPQCPTQVIDVRDLARWAVACAYKGTAGVFNATGEAIRFEEHMAIARQVAGHSGPVVLADPQWLQQQGVAPWAGPKSLPLWLPLPDYAGFARDSSAAVAAGLLRRPLEETLRDTLQWELSCAPSARRRAGLSDAEEMALAFLRLGP